MNEASSLTDLTIASGVRETASKDGAVLLDAEQGICFSLNPVGLTIWELLKQHSNVEQVVDGLEQQFHLPRAQLRSDVFEFVAQLEARHLIFRGPPQQKRSWIGRMFHKNRDPAH
jgi:coenzyme PQQ synthesis protein D (PqqD)